MLTLVRRGGGWTQNDHFLDLSRSENAVERADGCADQCRRWNTELRILVIHSADGTEYREQKSARHGRDDEPQREAKHSTNEAYQADDRRHEETNDSKRDRKNRGADSNRDTENLPDDLACLLR